MSIELIHPHEHDLGTFTVRRSLPAFEHRLIGPFIFFDHFGPATLAPGVGMDVRPHPHIGLSTVTFLFAGSALHRDSLGNVKVIVPGDINLMTAGRGIVHSERSTAEALRAAQDLHGIQSWVAVPRDREDDPPSFSHHDAASLPVIELDGASAGVSARVLMGEAFGERSPVPVLWPTIYVCLRLRAGASLVVPAEVAERGLYTVDSDVALDGLAVPVHTLAYLESGSTPRLSCTSAATVMLLGGAPIDGARFINWNFVASSRERIEAARTAWGGYPNERFAQVPGETEFIPLPQKKP
jgi:redox-sensitive bicupin YhaK (pirin superfamily)